MDDRERDALLELAGHALDEDGPGAWIKNAIRAVIEEEG